MIDGLGNRCDDNDAAFDAVHHLEQPRFLRRPIRRHGPRRRFERRIVLERHSATQPKLFKIPDEQLHSTKPKERPTLEVTDTSTTGSTKFKTDCCLYVNDTNSQYALKKANAPHADSQSINVLQKTDGSVSLKVGIPQGR